MAEIQQPEPSWEELLGSKNWDSLLHPLDLSLRSLILRCGDFCQATYDAFNNDQNSKFCGASRYGRFSFFDKVMLESASDYRVESFLYATARVSLPEAFLLHSRSRESWDRESNWIGYIATTSDETSKALGRREIYVVWRGTTRDYEWINVLDAKLESAEPLLRVNQHTSNQKHGNGSSSSDSDDENKKQPKVMLGWLTLYISDNPKSSFTKTSARAQLLGKIKELKERYKDENVSIVFTGHSLGASLSILSAFDVVENGLVDDIPVAAIVFGSPMVGDKAFDERMKRYPNLTILHIKNTIDMIPHYPSLLLGYVYSGTELVIDTRKSPSLKDSKNPGDWHNLQAMLHIVAGWNGEKGEFKLRVKRSLALVNKSCAFLKDECLVPGSWWVEKNKGLVRNEDGEWEMAPLTDEDLPTPE
ncbi:ACYLATED GALACTOLIPID- ASSOCIATED PHOSPHOLIPASE 1 [Hibiscus trionum]|uniref:Phospholipase A1 n=1 Tax=Hibiscus trionum TaxID=183268 RepID=A0A9W7ID37_HIBTR|nr:ACYLATED GALACTOLIPID- ASSOCIATED PHOSPHOLIPASE 1 [Hibiscus trionum]